MRETDAETKKEKPHPLPKEIQLMGEDETVCRFCGISYLIHREVSTLKDQLGDLQKVLKHYETVDDREQAMITKMNDLLQLHDRLRQEADQSEARARKFKQEAEAKVQLEIALKKFAEFFGNQKEDLKTLKKQTEENEKKYRNAMKEVEYNFRKFQNSIGLKISQLKAKSNEDLSLMNAKRDKLQEEIQQKEQKFNQKSVQFEELAQKACTLELQLNERKQECYRLKDEVENAQRDAQIAASKHKEMLLSANAEKDGEAEQLKKQIHAQETELDELRRFKSNKEMQTEQQVNELKRVTSINMQNVQTRVDFLTSEREQMVQNHQSQIEQLQESFRERLREADKFPQKMMQREREFTKERDDIIAQYEAQLRQQKSDFIEKMRIENAKHDEVIKDMSIKLTSAQTELRVEMNGLVEKHKAVATDLANSLGQEKRAHHIDLEQMKERLSKVENEVLTVQRISNDKDQEYQNELRNLRAEIARLQATLSKKESEVTFLQKTVHKECDERKELVEALKKARSQALLTKAQNASQELKKHVARQTTASSLGCEGSPSTSGTALPSLTAAGVGAMIQGGEGGMGSGRKPSHASGGNNRRRRT